MTPEYKLTIEGQAAKDSVLGGLLHSGYMLSVKRTIGENYEISVYGKERVDGKGIKYTVDMNKDIDAKKVADEIAKLTKLPFITTPHTSASPYIPAKQDTFWVDTTRLTCKDNDHKINGSCF
jgi:hypothetical protein